MVIGFEGILCLRPKKRTFNNGFFTCYDLAFQFIYVGCVLVNCGLLDVCSAVLFSSAVSGLSQNIEFYGHCL